MQTKAKTPWSFGEILLFWICAGALLGMAVGILRISGILAADPDLFWISQAGIAVHLLIHPAAPLALELSRGKKKSRRLIRILAVVLLLSILINLLY